MHVSIASMRTSHMLSEIDPRATNGPTTMSQNSISTNLANIPASLSRCFPLTP